VAGDELAGDGRQAGGRREDGHYPGGDHYRAAGRFPVAGYYLVAAVQPEVCREKAGPVAGAGPPAAGPRGLRDVGEAGVEGVPGP